MMVTQHRTTYSLHLRILHFIHADLAVARLFTMIVKVVKMERQRMLETLRRDVINMIEEAKQGLDGE